MLQKKHARGSISVPGASFLARVLRRGSTAVHHSVARTTVRPKRKKALSSSVRRLIIFQRWFRSHSVSASLASVKSRMIEARFGKVATDYEQSVMGRLLLSPPLMMKITRMLIDAQTSLCSITPDAWAEGCRFPTNTHAASDRSSMLSLHSSAQKSARGSLLSKLSSRIKKNKQEVSVVASKPSFHGGPSLVPYSAQADDHSEIRSEGSGSDDPAGFAANSRASVNSNVHSTKPKEKDHQRGGIHQVMGLLCKITHSTKVLAMKTLLYDVILPMKSELESMKQKHDDLTSRFDDARASFLKESVALRDQLRERPFEGRNDNRILEDKCFFNAKECLKPHEINFVFEVVREELKALMNGRKGSWAVDSVQLQKFLEFHQRNDATENVTEMKSELEKATAEVQMLKQKLERQKVGHQNPKKFVDMLEAQVSELRTDLIKENKANDGHKSHIELLNADLKRSQDDRDLSRKENDELQKTNKQLEFELASLGEKNALLISKVDTLEGKLKAASEEQAIKEAGSWSKAKSQTHEDEEVSAYINALQSENEQLKVRVSTMLEESIASMFGNKNPVPLSDPLNDDASLCCPSGAILTSSSRLEDVEAEIGRLQQEGDAQGRSSLTPDVDVKKKLAIAEFLRLSIRLQKMFGRWDTIEKKGMKEDVECSCGLASEVKEMQEVLQQLRGIVPQLVTALQNATVDSVRMHDVVHSWGSDVGEAAACIQSLMAKASLPADEKHRIAILVGKLKKPIPSVFTRLWDDAAKRVERKEERQGVKPELSAKADVDADPAGLATTLTIEGPPPPKRKAPPLSLPLATTSAKEDPMGRTASAPVPSPKARQGKAQPRPSAVTRVIHPRGGEAAGALLVGTRCVIPRGSEASGPPMAGSRSMATPRSSDTPGATVGSKTPKGSEQSRALLGFGGSSMGS